MRDFNEDLIKMRTLWTSIRIFRDIYLLVSLSSSLAVTTVTLINNIMMNNLEARMETSLVMVSLRPSSNLSICRGGAGWWGGEGEAQRVVSVGHN